jgi:hypothetical protein
MVPSLSWPDVYDCRLSQWFNPVLRPVLFRGLGHLLACRMRTDKVALSCLPTIMSSQPTHLRTFAIFIFPFPVSKATAVSALPLFIMTSGSLEGYYRLIKNYRVYTPPYAQANGQPRHFFFHPFPSGSWHSSSDSSKLSIHSCSRMSLSAIRNRSVPRSHVTILRVAPSEEFLSQSLWL